MSAIPTYPVAPSLRRVWHACYQNFCSPRMNPSGFINPADQSDVVCLKGGLVVIYILFVVGSSRHEFQAFIVMFIRRAVVLGSWLLQVVSGEVFYLSHDEHHRAS
ncbi:hypothetical protein FOCG_12505 [Fusarium oxysporum f. sp. radicis-lycopersici 26381]|nr:hypothetical protein FOWG_08552 [Fusarium oxysporum f. sp. lycopersici MN25]EXL46679.1 hypothetical protein FOCG_12505 [Fusarium oxysporum f. sp. radicis-lycopersici 26381]EWZ88680.1 hypothetical protein FOWG_08552 [Fusarium oxysporum f. sp. lycopersici MN25]EWZ88681.1 hypothetical protein FOWG_08552 [Fusarium oxysporum f. sp. lycopersici MN25]EWZ88682.1 hypothetical protein FOWG_08552 [Fusarium oxysporum f. sp. lycopersici MN25]